MKALPIQFDESIPAWEKVIYASSPRRSGVPARCAPSTPAPGRCKRFFGTTGKTPEAHWAFRSTSPLPRIKS
jgi:hypothetical protein